MAAMHFPTGSANSLGISPEYGLGDSSRPLNLAAPDPGGCCVEFFHSKAANWRRHSERVKVLGNHKRSCSKGIALCEQSTSDSRGSFIQNGGPDESFFTVSSQRILPRRSNIATPAALATSAPLAFDEEKVKPWRLDAKLNELQILRDVLKGADSLGQKLESLKSSPRVRAVFGSNGKNDPFITPIASLALETMGDYEIYLLKCLVAGGQEHLLELTPAWLDHLEESVATGSLSPQNGAQPHDKVFSRHATFVLNKAFDNAQLRRKINSMRGLPPHYGLGGRGDNADESGGRANGSARDEPGREGQASKEFCQDHVCEFLRSLLQTLIKSLHEMETFYDSIGGIIGYQAAALELIKGAEREQDAFQSAVWSRVPSNEGQFSEKFFVPVGPDLSQDKEYAAQAAGWGLESLPEMGEIYPLGGAGDRLGLVDELTGECLPVAMLPYCGRTLLEGHIRDLQAREYLHFKIFGRQCITPVAIMTSAAKRNNDRVTSLCESRGWFGRGRSNFCLFEQPLVPVVGAENGNWLIREPLTPILKPGGHGVIWKLACDKGVFNWFYEKSCKAAIVRQISNPIASTDVTLLALAGVGHQYNKKFGFASCERNVGAVEGVNVLVERSTRNGWEYCVTCVEYTEFSKLGIPDIPVSPGSMQAQYPANTNVLYVDLQSVEQVASTKSSASLPGMILNLKKPVVFEDYLGVTHSTCAGRIECTMQNAADFLLNKSPSRLTSVHHDSLDTFLIYNHRRKVTSSAKRRRKPSEFSLHQTPDGSFLDVTLNAHELLASCMVDMPEIESKQCYVEWGPPFIVLLHPALGPLWEVVRQKIHGGSIGKGTELQLEIAEICWRNVQVDGSLVILADNAIGSNRMSNGENILHYGEGCGRCRLENVKISNKGVDWNCKENVYWQHKVHRSESLKIILHGNSEFEAHDVSLEGSHTFEVPDGHKYTVTQGSTGLSCVSHPLPENVLTHGTWRWNYSLQGNGHVHLTFEC